MEQRPIQSQVESGHACLTEWLLMRCFNHSNLIGEILAFQKSRRVHNREVGRCTFFQVTPPSRPSLTNNPDPAEINKVHYIKSCNPISHQYPLAILTSRPLKTLKSHSHSQLKFRLPAPILNLHPEYHTPKYVKSRILPNPSCETHCGPSSSCFQEVVAFERCPQREVLLVWSYLLSMHSNLAFAVLTVKTGVTHTCMTISYR